MCAAISSWYTAQYANWNRTRRLSVPPYVATESNVRATAAARLTAADALILNINDVNNLMGASGLAIDTAKKADTLFGPGVGVISSGPEWTESKHVSNDELTPEVVKGWIAKSEEASNPTTTLQALVNLKRPSIKLSPLDHNEVPEAEHQGQHGLEFEFDCDAPKCAIKMHAIGQTDSAKVLVFEKVVEGGFGKVLKYDEGAILDLEQSENKVESIENSQSNPVSSLSLSPNGNASTADSGSISPPPNGGSGVRNKRRFSNFAFRKRSGTGGQRVVGPALAVVDADASTAVSASEDNGGSSAEHGKGKDEGGLKVTIELEALDEESHPLPNVNSQMTYLHIVRVGSHPAESAEEDRRPWVVKVVKREATIGAHVFHLHEIYGLSSAAPAPAAVETTQHAYPPSNQTADDQTSECLLCLSSPREVVLLPCRHLVACKECAVNMVEFGAGGTLVHSEGDPAPAAAAAEADNGGGVEPASPANAPQDQAVAPVVTAAVTQRRKRKAKGWYCPVCRQPYTSLLRITTTPPEKECARNSTSEENVVTSSVPPTMPPPAVTANNNGSLDVRSLFPRPHFLRSFSRNSRVVPPPAGSNMV